MDFHELILIVFECFTELVLSWLWGTAKRTLKRVRKG